MYAGADQRLGCAPYRGNGGDAMGVSLTRRRAERLDRLIDGRQPVVGMRDRTRLDVVTALRACEQVSPREEFRASLRAHLLAEPPTSELHNRELHNRELRNRELRNRELPATETVNGKRLTNERLTGEERAPGRGSRAWVGARPALIGALATSVLVTGIAVNAHRAVPGEPFYGLKLRVEQIQLDLTSNRVEKAKVHLDIARTRLGEIQTLMDDGRLPTKTTEIRGLLAAWRNEAAAGGDVLVAEARNGSDDALRAVRDFTADQTRDLRTLLDGLPGGQLRTMASDALDYVHGVDDTLTAAGFTPPSRAGAPAAVSTPVDHSPTREPVVGDPTAALPVNPSAAPASSAGPPTEPTASGPATADVPPSAGPAPSTPGRPGNAHAPTASPTPAATTPTIGTSTTPSTPPTGTGPDPDGIVANLLNPTDSA